MVAAIMHVQLPIMWQSTRFALTAQANYLLHPQLQPLRACDRSRLLGPLRHTLRYPCSFLVEEHLCWLQLLGL